MSTSSAVTLEEPNHPASAPPALARVLHVINGEHYSGAERVQDLLAADLPSLGFDVALACVKPGLFPKLRQATAAPLYELPMKGRLDPRPARRLAKLVRDEHFDLIHAHTPRTALVAAMASAATGVPVVYHVHSPAARDSTHRARNWLAARLERLCLARIAAVIAVSESLGRDTIAAGVPQSKVFVVPNGVPSRTPRRERWVNDHVWTLGAVALFRPRKGTEILLQALATLRSAGLDTRLLAVGGFETASHERFLKYRAAELGLTNVIEWTGFTRDVDSELRKMDLFVLPSLFGEGLPMVVLEAMATGVPVVASRVEGTPEAVRDGVDGLLVEPGNAAALAEAVRRFVDRRINWNAMHASAIARHAERFSDRAMATGTANVYRHVLGL